MTGRVTSESHILNIYENHDMSFDSLFKLVSKVQDGTLDGCEEKLDGQHVSLTWTRQKGLLFFSKGVSLSSVQKGGDNEETLKRKHETRPGLLSSLLRAFRTMGHLCEANLELTEPLFQNGTTVVEISVISKSSPNLIHYDEDQIRVIRATSLLNTDSFESKDLLTKFVTLAENLPTEIPVRSVPLVRLRPKQDYQTEVITLKYDLENLLRKSLMTPSNTIGDFNSWLVGNSIGREFPEFDPSALSRVSRRLALGEKSLVSKRDLSKSAWNSLQRIESDRGTFLGRALRPLEVSVQKLGHFAIQQTDFEVGSNDASRGEPIRDFVKRVRDAHRNGKIVPGRADPEKIKGSLLRIGDRETLFQKPVEGVVFPWDGKRLKLTGMFSAINQLHGFFTYGKDPAKIED